MQQLIVLATPDGVIDMTPQAIAARTSIPLKIIEKGLKFLTEPDPYTRTPGEDGCRIVLLDDHRPWGWRLVNHGKYMRMCDMKQKREADRTRIEEKRKQNKHVAIESQGVADVAHSDSDSDSDLKIKSTSSARRASHGADVEEKALPQSPTVIFIPLVDGTEYPITQADLDEFAKLYPAVDVPQTLNEVRGWNLANPKKRKTKAGLLRHVNQWLAKEQNSG